MSANSTLRPAIPCFSWLRAAAILLCFSSPAPLLAQLDSAAIVPHHFLVVYRNATIPGDVSARTHSIGAALLQRNERFGIVVVSTDPTQQDDLTVRQLQALPNVDYVLHDRLITAQRMVLRQEPQSQTDILSPASPALLTNVHVHPIGPATGHHAPEPYQPAPVPTPAQPTPPPASPPPPSADTYYATPQGWAVRQVGGYGHSVPGGPAHGPWDTTMGQGVRIAILDSGIDATHPDLAPNLALNLSEVSQDPTTGLPSPCDDGQPQDQTGHGTWAASLAAAALGPGTGSLIGVAPQATLLNIKVLQRMPIGPITTSAGPSTQCPSGQAAGLLSWAIQGIEDAMASRADIISMSFGTTVDLDSGEGAGLKAAFDRVTFVAAQAGIVLIAAAGNDGYDLSNPRFLELPAQARDVLSVVASTNPACAEDTLPGATCAPGPITLAYYSNRGASLNALAAPGGSYPDVGGLAVSGWIRGACSSGLPATSDGPPVNPNHSYGCFNLGHTAYVQAMGTSASAPLAAGVAALLRAAHPDWNAATIIATMRSAAIVSSTLPMGQINAASALELTPQPQTQDQPHAHPTTPSSGHERSSPTVQSHPTLWLAPPR